MLCVRELRLLDHRTEERELTGQSPPPAGQVPAPPDPEVVRRLDAIAAEGERLEPENGYFTTMRAAAAFAARRDGEALTHLRAVAAKPHWKDHAGEETRAQWRLMREVYGDHGAIQKIRAAYSILFPHFAIARSTARLALVHAARRERAGDRAGAREIRGHIMRLGATLADGSPSIIGRLVGNAVFWIGLAPVPPEPPLRIRVPAPLAGRPDWRPPTPEEQARHNQARRERYAGRIAAEGAAGEAKWIRDTGRQLDRMQQQYRAWMTEATDDAYQRTLRLAGWWLYDLTLLRQIAALLLLGVLAAWLARRAEREEGIPMDTGTWGVIYLLLFLTPALILVPHWWTDALAGSGSALLVVALLLGLSFSCALALVQWRAMRRLARGEELPADGQQDSPWVWTALAVFAACVPALAAHSFLRAAGEIRLGGAVPPWPDFIVGATMASLGHLGMRMYPFGEFSSLTGGGTPEEDPALRLQFATTLPVLLLLFFAFWRVAAGNLPLWSGLGRSLRRTAPVAVVLLAALYLVSLAPTIAADRSVERYVEQALVDELGVLPAGAPPAPQ
jgi:hypothetical protein